MNNTIMTAKNVFSDGLVMDFTPDNTLSSTLTSALNATLITFNGNEMALQNDMGNGRVETAYLPEGYVPLGTCEFGDIIYIVSYNPLTNKSLIGCFPSPERNISSDEISNISQNISSTDFLKFQNGIPTGQLVATSIKKKLFDSKYLNPGDKYIIYSNSNNLYLNSSKLTDYGNESHEYGTWPKLVKVHVVAIEETGKITYLDQTLKWYNDVHYYMNDLEDTSSGTPDLDSYRSLVSSAYSIFQSKNSGQLAVLVELELITGFNCAYSVTSKLLNKEQLSYNIYLHTSWSTNNNDINPCGLAILSSEWIGKDGGKYRIARKEGDSYIYGDLQGPELLPITNPDYSIKVELKRIYHPEESTSYTNYIGNLEVLSKNRIAPYNNGPHDTSYNYYINSDHTNYNVGWPNDSSNLLRDVTRITLVKTPEGEYIIDTYYFNLDDLEINDSNKIAKTRGVSDELYNSGEYDNSGGTGLVKLSSDIVNNYFKKDVTVKLIENYTLPSFSNVDGLYVPVDLSNFVWKFKVAPCMPYGVLELYAVDLIIDFSKVGKNITDLTQWRYWNLGQVCTLTYGLDINLSNNKLVKEVTFDFYDNQGIAATYRSSEKTSYSGIFTEQFGLNGNNTNYKLSSINSKGELIYHAGLKYTGSFTNNLVYWDGSNKPILATLEHDTSKLYINDAGSLYANFLYKVDIKVSYGVTDELGNFIESTLEENHYSRWIWINSMYNDYYYSILDFDKLPLLLDLGFSYNINSNSNYSLELDLYYDKNMSAESNNIPQSSLGATVTHINQKQDLDGNINISLNIGLSESYLTLYLLNEASSNLEVDIRLGHSYISTDDISIISEYNTVLYNSLLPIIENNLEESNGKLNDFNIGKTLKKIIYKEDSDTEGLELWESEDSYKNYINTFSIQFANEYNEYITLDSFKYTDLETGNLYNTSLKLTVSGNLSVNLGINLTLTGISFNKQCFGSKEEFTGSYPVVLPIIRSQENRNLLNIAWDSANSTFYFSQALGFTTPAGESYSGELCWRMFSGVQSSSVNESPLLYGTNFNIYSKSSKLLDALKTKNVVSPLVLIIWSALDKEKKTRRWYTEGGYIEPFTISNKNDYYFPLMSSGDSSKGVLCQLALNYLDKSFYLLNDAMAYYKELESKISQRISNIAYTLAELVAYMFAQIYYLTSTLESYTGYKFSNLCYTNDYLEIWGKHILVTLKPKEFVENLNSLVALANGVKLSSYIESINNKFPLDNIFNKVASNNNVNVLLLSSTQIINFKYTIPNTDKLKTTYLNMISSISTLIYFADKESPIPSTNIYDNLLYHLNSDNELVPLNKSFTYKTCQWKWKDNLVDAGDLLVASYGANQAEIKELGQLIQYDADLIFSIKKYPTRNLFNIGMGEDDGDRNYYTGLSESAEFTGTFKNFKYNR